MRIPVASANPATVKSALHRPALEIPHRDAEGMGEEAGDAGAFDQGRAVVGRRLGPHGFGWWELGGAAHGAENAHRRGAGAHQEGEGEGHLLQAEREVGESGKTDGT